MENAEWFEEFKWKLFSWNFRNWKLLKRFCGGKYFNVNMFNNSNNMFKWLSKIGYLPEICKFPPFWKKKTFLILKVFGF